MFFFFKQKTAYELRISDWSSDVCSSDLGKAERNQRQTQLPPPGGHAPLHRHGRRVTPAPTFRQAARSRRLALAPPRGEQELGIAIGLFAALEHQIAGGVEGSPVKAGRHRLIERIELGRESCRERVCQYV